MISRRMFLKVGAVTGAGLTLPTRFAWPRYFLQAGTMQIPIDPTTIPKYTDSLVIPPAMPQSTPPTGTPADVDYYEIAVRQFEQQILPPGYGATTVWSYVNDAAPATLNYPAFTIEATVDRPVRVKWINGLVDPGGNYLPHLLPVDQTLHWANPPGPRDMEPMDPPQTPYTGPVPLVTHLHGAEVHEESDGYTEAWYLPPAANIPAGYFTEGSHYDEFRAKFLARYGVAWEPGTATFQYPNAQRATTLWFHDHALGITRLNVYAGPAGFYLLRGGADDLPAGTLRGPAPQPGDEPGTSYYEIPLAIQDRSFNDDGSLFYPDNRAFFEGLNVPGQPEQFPGAGALDIPFEPEAGCGGLRSDVSPIWNPEFFGNTMVVNGKTWPFLDVEKRRYRLRLLNGCNSRFLLLQLVTGNPELGPTTLALPFWVIGADGGFLAQPTSVDTLLLGPAERADVIVDFTDVLEGTEIYLINVGPDEPFGGGAPGADFTPADPFSTGQVMRFDVGPIVGQDNSTPPAGLVLPGIVALGPEQRTRPLALNEQDSPAIRVSQDTAGNVVLDCANGEIFGPTEALLGVVTADGMNVPLDWENEITEMPGLGEIEVWEFYNFTMDAHPIHIHLVQFEIVNRQDLVTDEEGMPVLPVQLVPGTETGPEPWEDGRKDTVIAYPGQVTRVKALFDLPGLFVWHCHILEHEDNEMMRPYRVVHRVFLPDAWKNATAPAE